MPLIESSRPAETTCGYLVLHRGAAEHGDDSHHGGLPEPYGSPVHGTDTGVALDPYDGSYRFATRGHDPNDLNQRIAYSDVVIDGEHVNTWHHFAVMGILKRAWEYAALQDDLRRRVETEGLHAYLRAASPNVPRLVDGNLVEESECLIPAAVEDLAAVFGLTEPGPIAALQSTEWEALGAAFGVTEAHPSTECVVLAMIRQIHRAFHVLHCK
jgi:hypothetical protein